MRNNSKHTIRAFTIMELAVAMLLTGLVVSLSYTGYAIIGQQFNNHYDKNRKLQEFNRFIAIFNVEVASAKEVKYMNNGVLLDLDSLSVQYDFNGDDITRTTAFATDTFLISTDELRCRFDNQDQLIPGLPADEIYLNCPLYEQAIPLYIKKPYGAAFYMKRNK